jgi:hypothetical protein
MTTYKKNLYKKIEEEDQCDYQRLKEREMERGRWGRPILHLQFPKRLRSGLELELILSNLPILGNRKKRTLLPVVIYCIHMHIVLVVDLYLIPSIHDDSTDYSHLHQVTQLSPPLILYRTAPKTSTGCRASHPPSSGMMRISRKSRERCLSRRLLSLGYRKHQELWIGNLKL